MDNEPSCSVSVRQVGNKSARKIRLAVKELMTKDPISRFVLTWKEDCPTAPKRLVQYYSFLVDISREEVAMTAKGLFSLVSNIEQNMTRNTPRNVSMVETSQSAFVSKPFTDLCLELDVRHIIIRHVVSKRVKEGGIRGGTRKSRHLWPPILRANQKCHTVAPLSGRQTLKQ